LQQYSEMEVGKIISAALFGVYAFFCLILDFLCLLTYYYNFYNKEDCNDDMCNNTIAFTDGTINVLCDVSLLLFGYFFYYYVTLPELKENRIFIIVSFVIATIYSILYAILIIITFGVTISLTQYWGKVYVLLECFPIFLVKLIFMLLLGGLLVYKFIFSKESSVSEEKQKKKNTYLFYIGAGLLIVGFISRIITLIDTNVDYQVGIEVVITGSLTICNALYCVAIGSLFGNLIANLNENSEPLRSKIETFLFPIVAILSFLCIVLMAIFLIVYQFNVYILYYFASNIYYFILVGILAGAALTKLRKSSSLSPFSPKVAEAITTETTKDTTTTNATYNTI